MMKHIAIKMTDKGYAHYQVYKIKRDGSTPVPDAMAETVLELLNSKLFKFDDAIEEKYLPKEASIEARIAKIELERDALYDLIRKESLDEMKRILSDFNVDDYPEYFI